MGQITMYAANAGSPTTTTTSETAIDATNIAISELGNLKAAPNQCTLEDETDFEVVVYSEKSAASGPGTITVARSGAGHEGTAKVWPSGTIVANYPTAYAFDAFKNNIQDIIALIDLIPWVLISTGYTATPASTSTITMTSDLTGTVKVGYGIKYTIGGVVYYGVITAISSNLLTLAGAPLSGDITALHYSKNPAQVVQVDFFIPGTFADAANDSLLNSDVKTAFDWNLLEARLVQIRHKVYSIDTGVSQPRANISVNGNKICTANSGAGLEVATTWTSTTIDINTSNYTVQRGSPIEITCDANGANDNAAYLTISGVFVLV